MPIITNVIRFLYNNKIKKKGKVEKGLEKISRTHAHQTLYMYLRIRVTQAHRAITKRKGRRRRCPSRRCFFLRSARKNRKKWKKYKKKKESMKICYSQPRTRNSVIATRTFTHRSLCNFIFRRSKMRSTFSCMQRPIIIVIVNRVELHRK